jgi:hypothetical protein
MEETMPPSRRSSAKTKILIALLYLIAVSSCGAGWQDRVPSELTGYWSDQAHLLEIRSDGVMVLAARKMFSYAGRTFPVFIVPGSAGERAAVELEKCDPRKCFYDIETGETFDLETSWRSLRAAWILQEYQYQWIDDSHLQIEPVIEIEPGDLIADLTGSAEFQVSSDTLVLIFPDRRVFSYRRGCEAPWCVPLPTP